MILENLLFRIPT